MVPTELLRLTFPDLGALEREIATNVRYGRVFVSEVIDAPVLTEGVIVIVHPQSGRELSLSAQVVMVNYDGPMRGTGIALRNFGPADVERVQAFVAGADPADAAPAPAAEPRVRQMTPAPMAAAVADRPRQQTPVPMPATLSDRPRQQTPIPMPATLSDRPRRATPDARNEAVTVRPSMSPGAAATVPPAAPENDWSDLQNSGLVHEATTRAPPGGEEPTVQAEGERESVDGNVDVDVRAQSVEDAHAHVHVHEHVHEHEKMGGQAEADEDSQWADFADPSAAARPVADDDWSDVAAATEEPVDASDDEAEAEGEFEDQTDIEARATEDDEDGEEAAALDEDPARPAPTELQQENRQHRLRTLNVVEQLKVARRGELSDRVVVERLYGKQVWEALLQNPRLTLPEVARIARKGTVPRPLIEQILENQMWTKAPNVQRALLSNPKLTPEGILKLLKMLPKHELKIMEKATAYPLAVRDAARKMLRESK